MNADPRSFLESVAGYAQTVGQTSADRPIRIAVVDPAYISGLPKVTFEGESTMSTKGYAFVQGYYPVASNRVALVPIGNGYLIIGAVDAGVATANLAQRMTALETLNAGDELAYTQISANSTAVAALTDVAGLSITFSLAVTSTVRLIADALLASTVAADHARIRLTDGADVAQVTSGRIVLSNASSGVRTYITKRVSLPAGTYTYKIKSERLSGTGNIFINAGATDPAYISAILA